MKTSTKILIDELIEQSHIEDVDNVIFWALQDYADKNKGFNSGAVAYAISQRMIDDAECDDDNFQNYKLIKALAKEEKESTPETSSKQQPKALIIDGVTNCAILETMHQQVFTEFHNLRKQKGNARYIQIDGKEANEIIRLGKLATKKEHCL